eukprot:2557558-Prymnesium_polylepis.1
MCGLLAGHSPTISPSSKKPSCDSRILKERGWTALIDSPGNSARIWSSTSCSGKWMIREYLSVWTGGTFGYGCSRPRRLRPRQAPHSSRRSSSGCLHTWHTDWCPDLARARA